MKTIRVAQMSDLHYCPSKLDEADRCFTHSVSEAISLNVGCAVITGDSTDHALDAHSPAFEALARQLQRLANHCPVLMLQGTFSHEPQGLLKLLSLIGAKYPIAIADRIASFGLPVGYSGSKGFELIETGKSYEFVVNALPTLNKADIAALTSNQVGEAAIKAGEIVSEVLQAFAPMNRQLRAEGVPTMLISHGTVLNCVTEHGVPMAGSDHEFGSGGLFSACADVVALGHIHKHQVWKNDANGFAQTIAYAGSIGRFHHGEIDDKVWIEWNMVAGKSSFSAHETPARQTIDLFFDGPPDMDAIREAASGCQGAWVRVRYAVNAENAQSIDRDAIKAALSGAAGVQIEGTTLVIERVRAPGISTAHTVEDKLRQWCEVAAIPADSLSDRLLVLQVKTPEEIVTESLARCKVTG